MKRALADMFVNCASADEILGSISAALFIPVFVRGGEGVGTEGFKPPASRTP